ncbi:NIPSNAP family protein [Priestia taiwanensis]|uniref:NIPSNAP domain-containing protein n=1 Tax=Priestia taiwanensis TaxID=1347902 RepID=A0A917EPY5_9BACI|nr:NIPSNAP family protein [Priestia taiwanensis]MBM7363987.1 hypothetical protein [Priestia taiwanensis]GGE70761.1 hypothetical protein GCM10007140_20770 [Priestia taiwanensis]
MFHRRKYYIIKKEFVEIFNNHFNETNLPNQLKHGARLVGRWMRDNEDDTVEIFAIWEYDSYEEYVRIEKNVRSDEAHLQRIQEWYEKHGGRAHVIREYIVAMQNEAIVSTVRE